MPNAITPYIGPRHPAYRPDALNPEVVDPGIADVEAMARWLDYAWKLPGGFRFGYAGIIGLIPGIGTFWMRCCRCTSLFAPFSFESRGLRLPACWST